MKLTRSEGGSLGSGAHPRAWRARSISGRRVRLIRLVVYADPVRLADDTLNGILCFRLHVKRSAKPSTVWIGQDTYLIRRIDSGSKFSDFRTEDTTVYEPIVDIEVDDAELAFGTPPAKGGLTKS